MSGFTKFTIILSVCLIVVGLIGFSIIMTANDWDFTKIASGEYVQEQIEVAEDFNAISISVDTADVEILPSSGEDFTVSFPKMKDFTYVVSVEDGILKVELKDDRKWFKKIFNFTRNKLIVLLPKTEYEKLSVSSLTGDVKICSGITYKTVDISGSTGDVNCYANVSERLKIKVSTGDIDIKNVFLKNANLKVSTGDILLLNVNCDEELSVLVRTGDVKIDSVTCGKFYTTGSTGDVNIIQLIANESFYVKRDTGDVKLRNCDGGEITVITTTGDVTASFLSEKNFNVETNTGKKDVPNSGNGGKCEIRTDTGDIVIDINKS